MRPEDRHVAFAAGVARRHGIARASRPVERVLHAVAGPAPVIGARLSRMLVLRVAAQVTVAGAAPGRATRGPAVVPAAAAEAASAASIRERLVLRLLARETRVSSLEREAATRTAALVPRPGRAPGSERVGQRTVVRELQRVFARPAAAPAHAPAAVRPREEAAGHAATASWRLGSPLPAMPAAAAAGAGSVDVDRLTREVMRGIDERILAHRERLGRSGR
jgi:hypothetical protein